MTLRVYRFALSAFVLGLTSVFMSGNVPSPAAAAALPRRTPAFIQLNTFQPLGFHGRLTLTGNSVGKILHTADGGQVFGFDVNQNGTDGLLGSAKTVSPQGQVVASLETFDQPSMTIVKTVIMTRTMDDWVTFGIFGADVGLVQHDHVVNGKNHRLYVTLNPVALNSINGTWTPPNASRFLLSQVAPNQNTATTAVLGENFSSTPLVFSTNVATNTFGPVFHLDPNRFGGADGPQLAIDTVHNDAVIATSPDAGRVGGQPPIIAIVDLTTGAFRQFSGVLIPPFNSGYVNGFAVDSATGIACTSTELDANVEFYNLATGSGFNVSLPGSNNNQFNSGEAVVNDPIHKLFLVAQPNGTVGPAGDSVVDIYDESGNLVKSIVGFKAAGVTPGLAVNPKTRTGYIDGPTFDAITKFTY